MPVSISKTEISSYVGDVLPLYLKDGENDLSAADITWSVTGDAACIRSFATDPLSPFTHGVLMTLQRVGEATVTATLDGVNYTCRVHARAARTLQEGDTLHFYRGDLHTHTATTHTPAKFAAQPHIQAPCIAALGADERLDFGILSDHASVMRRRGFFEEFIELENADPKDTVIFPGSESEVTVLEYDRMGLPHKHAGEIVCLGVNNCSSVKSFEEFEEDMSQNPAPVCIFAHPFVLGVGQNSLWSFPYQEMAKRRLAPWMRGIEMGNGAQKGGCLLFEYAYSLALDAGFHVSPVCSSDTHGPTWGFPAMKAKTILMASEKTREAFLDAMRAGRFYASESSNVKLTLTVNGAPVPTTLPLTDTYHFHVELSQFEEDACARPTRLEVISDYGKNVYTCTDFGDTVDFTLHSDTARYFYLRLLDEKARKTWSATAWTGRDFDAPAAAEKPIIPLDGSDFTATEVSTGANAAAAIDGDPHVAFESTLPRTSILIDMKKEREICAVGYWARRFTKDWIKETSVDWKAEIGDRMQDIVQRYVTEYAVSTSTDGVHFTEVKAGAIRAFGDEEIFRFPAHGARFVRFDALSTIGKASRIPAYVESPVAIGELTVFEEDK